jgi:anti-anti-sigma factor
MKFTALAATRKAAVLVDLSEVNFIASIGMRTLTSSAKAQANRGGKIVLYNAQPMVREALETAGINQVIPLFDDLNSAHQALQGGYLTKRIGKSVQIRVFRSRSVLSPTAPRYHGAQT